MGLSLGLDFHLHSFNSFGILLSFGFFQGWSIPGDPFPWNYLKRSQTENSQHPEGAALGHCREIKTQGKPAEGRGESFPTESEQRAGTDPTAWEFCLGKTSPATPNSQPWHRRELWDEEFGIHTSRFSLYPIKNWEYSRLNPWIAIPLLLLNGKNPTELSFSPKKIPPWKSFLLFPRKKKTPKNAEMGFSPTESSLNPSWVSSSRLKSFPLLLYFLNP